MSNDCKHTLTVIGLKDDPNKFATAVEREIYGDPAAALEFGKQHGIEDAFEKLRRRVEVKAPQFRFETGTGANIEALANLSKKTRGAWFFVKYSNWESGYRGQAVIRDGEVIEHIHRVGYKGPGYLFADVTHPVVDLSAAYSEPTLALKAQRRLHDAIQIVRDLKETLEDPRFADSRYRAQSDKGLVKQTHEGLTGMLTAMMQHASGIIFEGVLVEEPTKNPSAAVDGDAAPPRARTSRKAGRQAP